jgi:hypothetical protein
VGGTHTFLDGTILLERSIFPGRFASGRRLGCKTAKRAPSGQAWTALQGLDLPANPGLFGNYVSARAFSQRKSGILADCCRWPSAR